MFLEGASANGISSCFAFHINRKPLDPEVPFRDFLYLTYVLNHHSFCQQRASIKRREQYLAFQLNRREVRDKKNIEWLIYCLSQTSPLPTSLGDAGGRGHLT